MNEQAQPISKSTFKALSESISLRATVVAILALLMLIPLGFVGVTVKERGSRYSSVLADIANTWGQPQTLLAAIVVIPFTETEQTKETITDKEGNQKQIDRVRVVQRYAYFLPRKLDINVDMSDEFRQRGIFRSLVYNASLAIDAEYGALDVKQFSNSIKSINWEGAWLAVGLSDTRAINSVETFEWQSKNKELSPGTQISSLYGGFHAKLDSNEALLTRDNTKTLKIAMNIKGSGSFDFTPLGETTNVQMNSTWPHPSFKGNTLPDAHDIGKNGFSARWSIPHLARNYQQSWRSQTDNINLYEFRAGVSMFEPVSLYSQVTRSVKYGLLFTGLTFLTLFIFELAIKRRLHMVQYGLIGIALSLFFLVLLSLSEHVAFIKAYTLAALLTISMISTYVWVALGNFGRASIVFVLLSALYAVLYSLLQFEDFALLVGTALLVFVVMVLMFVTRNIQNDKVEQPIDSGLTD